MVTCEIIKKVDLKFEHVYHSVLYVAVKQRVYVLVGYEQRDCEYYDINADSCIEIAPVNDQMKCMASACLFNDKFIYLISGHKEA